jgi:hypothetical protein
MEPEGILKGWQRTVRITPAMMKAEKITRIVSANPPSFLFAVVTLIRLSSFRFSARDLVAVATGARNEAPGPSPQLRYFRSR